MATSKIKSPNATSETLGTGAVLIRDGNVRILRLDHYTRSTSLSIPSSDRPSSTISGMGVRLNSTAYIAIAMFQVQTNGSVQILVAGQYNNSNGWSYAQNSDVLTGQVVWTIN